MTDIVFLSVALAFFGLCALYVRACDAIVRSNDASGPADEGEARPAGDGEPAARS